MEIIEEKIKITLGDGSKWELPYDPSSYNVDYNISEFKFLQTEGAYIDRATMGVRRYDLKIYFLNADTHLQDYKSFEKSCRDSRYWLVSHPYNGDMNMQPLSIEFNPTPLHTTATISLAETLTKDGVLINSDFRSNIEQKTGDVNSSALDRADEINDKPNDKNAILNSSDVIDKNLDNEIEFENVSLDYKSELNKIKNQSNDALAIMQGVQQQVMMPIYFIKDVKDTVSFIENQFNEIKNIIDSSILAYEFLGASIISALCLGVVPNEDKKYSNTNDIDTSVNKLTNTYNEYIQSIQSFQSINGYVMNYKLFFTLHELVIFTINHLYDIAVDAPLVVSDVTAHDTNPIVLSHIYGIEIDDLFLLNNWSVNRSTFIEKDTTFKYYIN